MEEGTFVEWLKRDGDPIRPGDPLFVLESEKAAENIEALDAGILRLTADSPQPGDAVKVGQVIALVAAVGEVLDVERGTPRAVEEAVVQAEAPPREERAAEAR